MPIPPSPCRKKRPLDEDDADSEFLGILLDIYDGPFAMLTACLDESENGPVFCVSGVLLARNGLKTFLREWKRELRVAGVPYHHSVDCAHGRKHYKAMPLPQRMEIHKNLCQIMAKHVIGSMTVFSIPAHYKFEETDWGYSVYTVCAYLCMDSMFDVAHRLGREKKIAFFIEQGSYMSQLASLLQRQDRDDLRRHNFSPKEGMVAVQAADVFAYEACRRIKDKAEKPDEPMEKAMRQSLRAIVTSADHRFMILDESQRRSFLAGLKPQTV